MKAGEKVIYEIVVAVFIVAFFGVFILPGLIAWLVGAVTTLTGIVVWGLIIAVMLTPPIVIVLVRY